jgi:hypothetical protein
MSKKRPSQPPLFYDPTALEHSHPDALNLDLGWRPDPEGCERVVASLPYPGELAAAAPNWQGDGLTGDYMPYLSYYEVDVPGWKPKDKEPPYIPQVGNNCTSRGMADGLDLLQFMMIADPDPAVTETIQFIRVCVEVVYAFGLFKAGMRGDNGCYGGAIAQGVFELGCVPYDVVGGTPEETRSRLISFANNPKAVVDKYKDAASPFKVGSIARVTTWEECCAGIANKGIITAASSVGYVGSRDSKGIIRRRGRWDHQMFWGGIIRSDGVESLVEFQSWGPNNPTGPQPFHLPSFAWRTVREDVEAQLAAKDCWLVRVPPLFKKTPLPNRWTNTGIMA